MMKYKGYTAVVEFDDDAKVFCGEVADTMDVITFQSANAKELEKEFHKSVDEYLKFCVEMKKDS
jgi:predicted HicB family RNase H-like nuclease